MWIQGLEAYYAPTFALILFLIIALINRVMPKRSRILFVVQTVLILILIVVTYIDFILETNGDDGFSYTYRRITTFLYYVLCPLACIGFVLLYVKNDQSIGLYTFPIAYIANIAILILGIFNGVVYKIDDTNKLTYGPLFFVPFVVSLIYMVYLIYFATKEKENHNKKYEIVFLLLITLGIFVAVFFEYYFETRLIIPSTITASLLLYYLVLCLQNILQDRLTGALSAIAFDYFIDINKGHEGTISVIDVIDMNEINSGFGKDFGDNVLISIVSAINRCKSKKMHLYRIKEDKFVLISRDANIEDVGRMLDKAKEKISVTKEIKPQFAYGSAIFHNNDDLRIKLNDATKVLNINKEHLRR